jgi:hypothetical protein
MIKKMVIIQAFLVFAGSLLAAQEIKIDYRYKVSGPDSGNFLIFAGRLKYIEALDDEYDGKTG